MNDALQVIAAAEERASALAAGNAKRLRELLHEQFRWTTHLGETFDRDEYIRRNTAGGTVWRSQTLTDAEVVSVADTSVLLARVTDEIFSIDNAVETFHMPMTQVWVRSTYGWKCLAGHAGPRTP